MRIPGAGMLRTISPVSGSIRNSLPDAGTAIQYLSSTNLIPCAPDAVAFAPFVQMPDPGVTHCLSVLPVFGSTFMVLGGLPSEVFVEATHREPLYSAMPLPWIDSVWIERITDPSSGFTRNALLGSTWSKIHRPSGTKARSFGSLQGAFHSFSTRLAMTGTLALSSIASARVAAARLAAPARKFRRENSLSMGITLLKVVTMIHRTERHAQA